MLRVRLSPASATRTPAPWHSTPHLALSANRFPRSAARAESITTSPDRRFDATRFSSSLPPRPPQHRVTPPASRAGPA